MTASDISNREPAKRKPPLKGQNSRITSLSLLSTLILAGCSTAGRRLPEDVVLAKEKENESNADQRIHSAGGTVKVFTAGKDKTDNYYTVTWKQAEADFNLEEAVYGGKIELLSGTIVKDGKVQSTFVAREGSVDKGTKRLNLAGGVKVTSKENDAALESDVMAYDADSGVIEAANGIKAQFAGYSVKDIKMITAKADLSEAWNDMKNGKKTGSLLTAVTAVSIAAGSAPLIQNDLLGFRITGTQNVNFKALPGGQTRLTVTGRPVIESPKQGLRLEASEIIALAKPNNLISAELKGGITFSSVKSDEKVIVTAPSAVYTDADQKLVVPGALTLDRKNGQGETVFAKGSGGTIVVDRNAGKDKILKSAELTGPITFKMNGKRLDSETKKITPYSVDASGNNLIYRETDNKIILSGNVVVDGDDPVFVGKMSGVERIEITLTESREIDSIDLKGDTAKTVIEYRQKPPTTGGGGGKRKK